MQSPTGGAEIGASFRAFVTPERMLRRDLRNPGDLRPFSVELGLISEADGSAAVSFGNTKVVASLVGPAQPKYGRHELYDRAAIEFDIQITAKTIVEGSDVMQQKKRYEQFLKDALEGCIDATKFPRTLILFNVLMVNNDGSLLEAAVNACVLAVLDAGLPMLFVPTAIAISSFGAQSTETSLLVDPTLAEETDSSANCTIVLRVSSGSDRSSVIATECTGLISVEAYKAANELAVLNCQTLLATMRRFMEAKIVGEAGEAS
jgi:exosome complex component RRP41